MAVLTKEERDLLKAFNDYDQTVDVVSCWQAYSTANFTGTQFHRFPKFTPGDLTPDFALTFGRIDSEAESRAGLGSFVCDIKKFPNPYSDPNNEHGDFSRFDKSIEQLKKYSSAIELLTGAKLGIKYTDHDIVLITKGELVDVVYSYLSNSAIQKPFNLGRPLVLVEYTYDGADQQERYVFRWKQGEHNSPFSHPILRKLMVDRSQSMRVPPHIFIPCKLQNVICNDPPPIIYLLVFLWLEVFPNLLTPEQYAALQDRSGKPTFRFRTSATQLANWVKNQYGIVVKVSYIRECLTALARMKRAYKTVNTAEDEYEVVFSNLSARPAPAQATEANDKRNESREYAVVFARMLAQANALQVQPRKGSRRDLPGQATLFPV